MYEIALIILVFLGDFVLRFLFISSPLAGSASQGGTSSFPAAKTLANQQFYLSTPLPHPPAMQLTASSTDNAAFCLTMQLTILTNAAQ